MATHTYGNPADAAALAEVARRNGVRLFFDAAHAFGSRLGRRPVGGLGDGEVFSLSPTKVMVAAEGGLIATNDDMLAERCRIGRDYGNPGDYDCLFVGLNARMSEVHAAIALASLEGLEERIVERNELADRYHQALGRVPGVSFPQVRTGDRSTFKDLTILVEPGLFGGTADELASALEAEGIESKRYYSPPVHAMRAYRTGVAPNGNLRTTDWAAERVLSLPMWFGMTDEPDMVAEAVARIQRHMARRAGAQKRYAG
jgi:dTDP-4-amino-4,6-dideoxygalactose transaminase